MAYSYAIMAVSCQPLTLSNGLSMPIPVGFSPQKNLLVPYIRTWKSSKGNCAERPPICVSSMLFNIWRTIMLSHSARRNVLHAFV